MSTDTPSPPPPNARTSPPPSTIILRPARLHDHPQIASLLTRAFHNDILFGHTIHPHRHSFPHDPTHYWLSRNLVAHFDWSHLFLVAVTVPTISTSPTSTTPPRQRERERIIGIAHWSRIGLSTTENALAGWGLHRWWDVRRLLRPLAHWCVWFLTHKLGWWRNRAADPAREGIVEASYGFIDHVWDPRKQRCPSLYLESLGVEPAFQGLGVGRLLVQRGLRMAEEMGVSASVISADGKEGFYRRCGYEVGPVGRSGEGEWNPLWRVPGGMVFFREAPGRVVGEKEHAEEVEEALKWLRRDNEAGWPSVWLDERRAGV